MKYKWHGSGAIHTPSGVVEHGQEFEASPEWVASHPRWVRMGLITIAVPTEKKPVVKK